LAPILNVFLQTPFRAPADESRQFSARTFTIGKVMKRSALAFSMLVVFLGGVLVAAPVLGQDMSFKIGLNRASTSGMEYTHDDGSTPVTISESSVGNELFIEYLISERFGLEINSTISPLKRTYSLESGGTTISQNVIEEASYTLYGANLYFSKAGRKGLKFLVGLFAGTADISHSFEGGTLGTKSTSDSTSVTVVKLGLDWITKMAGFRFQYQNWEGTASNTTQISGVKQTGDMTGSVISLGVFAFF
jgi:hypothetical protein